MHSGGDHRAHPTPALGEPGGAEAVQGQEQGRRGSTWGSEEVESALGGGPRLRPREQGGALGWAEGGSGGQPSPLCGTRDHGSPPSHPQLWACVDRATHRHRHTERRTFFEGSLSPAPAKGAQEGARGAVAVLPAETASQVEGQGWGSIADRGGRTHLRGAMYVHTRVWTPE